MAVAVPVGSDSRGNLFVQTRMFIAVGSHTLYAGWG